MKTPRTSDAAPTAVDDDFSGDTKAHYLPNEPRSPAETVPPRVEGEVDEIAEIAALFASSTDVPRDSLDHTIAPAEAPQLLQLPQMPIAAMFQETLWRAFRAGALSADPTYEAFASWYAREVLG